LADAGVPVGVMVAPVIPALNDHEIEAILAACADAGAREAGYVFIRLPLEVSPLLQEWLRVHAPDRATRVMRHIREAHGGRDYDPAFGARQRGDGPYAALVAARFQRACAKLGLNAARLSLRTDQFVRSGAHAAQLTLWPEQ
jgi:DNA repair photolyase